MNIFFYPPFKPLDHGVPSGDLVTATGLYGFLENAGHRMWPVSRLRARWIFWKPWLWPLVVAERARILHKASWLKPHLWLTYHTYFKAPDVIGPWVCRRLGLPYVIFQGSYSTRRRKKLKTWPGFVLNKNALLAARHVFVNSRADLTNLGRIIPQDQLTYVTPGIHTSDFAHHPEWRETLRRQWGVGQRPVVMSTAMFRADVKTQGLAYVIRACGRLVRDGLDLSLVIAGDGVKRAYLEQLAREELADKVIFTGRIARKELYRYYSAADVFAFPGFREALGMVYLEAQACGLPVVACRNGGVPEVVRAGETGFLTPLGSMDAFTECLKKMLTDPGLRRKMGEAGRQYVRQTHDLNTNYKRIGHVLNDVASHTKK